MSISGCRRALGIRRAPCYGSFVYLSLTQHQYGLVDRRAQNSTSARLSIPSYAIRRVSESGAVVLPIGHTGISGM